MEAAPDNLAHANREELVWLARLLLELAQERSLDGVLRKAIDAAAAVPGVALARVYLLAPGDICPTCPQRSVCPDQAQCLHAAVSGGRLRHGAAEEWSSQEDDYRRIPLGDFPAGRAVTGGIAVVGRNREGEGWIADPALAEREQLCGYIHEPIKYRGAVLGLFAVLLRAEPGPDAETLTRVIADHLGAAVANARAFAEVERLRRQLELDNEYLREEIVAEGAFGGIIGQGPAIRSTLEQVDLVAPTDATVLIQGESGTGKELVAREIHRRSRRAARPLVKVNCAAVPPELYESEFFGHARGAFTGALRDRAGRFEVADGGTLFLDEVGEIPLVLQGKLLRVLQEGTYERVGEEQSRLVDVRVIAATNRVLKKEMTAGRFREDLYYRLNVVPITVNPLRERREDIPMLAAHFLDHACQRLHLRRPRLTRDHVRELQQYDWAGNVRELENVIERAVIMARRHGQLRFDLAGDGPRASAPAALPPAGREGSRAKAVLPDAEVRRLERENIQAALRQCGGRIRGSGGAAELLGLKPTTLASRIKTLGIRKPTA
jgi:transcriptional regulator with GAF, ATPase, and Fis domain